MQSSSNDRKKQSAEQRFREAFERLKLNAPTRLPYGTPISQNNVAKEAGCDPSALRKGRFQSLVSEIQGWVVAHQEKRPPSARQQVARKRQMNRSVRETIADLKRQRDAVAGLLADANLRIVELTEELSAANARVEQIRPPAPVIALTKQPSLEALGGGGKV